jgi:hypothetical protein
MEKLFEIFLWPGNTVCDLLKVEGEDHRLILRLWTNLIFYGTISLIIALNVF